MALNIKLLAFKKAKKVVIMQSPTKALSTDLDNLVHREVKQGVITVVGNNYFTNTRYHKH